MIVACLPLVLTALWSHCQEETPQNPDSARTQVDVRVAPERMVEAPIRIERSQDAARFLPLSEDRVRPLEDYLEVPLPIPRVVQAGENGDVLIREASGDPFFLSFAAGDYYPPANELLDPLLVQQLPVPTDGRQGGYTYAFVMFSKVMTDERMGLLESMGCRLLGRYPHYTLRVALPSYLLGDVSTLPFVRWVGIPRSWQKISPHIQSEPSDTNVEGIESFHVSVFESDFNPASTSTPFGGGAQTESGERVASVNGRDQRSKTWMSNGWMQAALEARGVKIRSYNRRLHCFQVRMTRAQMDQVIGLDFVLAVEPVLTPTLASLAPAAPAAPVPHDESVAMIAADAVRPFYGGGFSQTAILGIIDSGVEMDHWDIGGNGTPFGGFATACDPNVSGWDDDVANQGTGHGTHVLGTILGRGVVKVDQRGVAPGLATWGGTSRIFNYRAYAPGNCVHDPGDVTWGPGDLQPIVDWFKLPKTDSLGDTTPKPHVINNSWGRNPSDGQPLVPTGVEYNCRVIDDAVYTDNQLFVFSAGNNGNGTGFLCVEASSKNALTVGNVVDHIPAGVFQEPGSLWAASSRGPCGDGRWKPNLVAPGHLVLSARSDQNQGYKNGTGTSMAAPHVTGVAATLIDHYPSKYAYKPASISALLMATALTKSDLLLGDPNPPGATKNHLNTYGAGRVNSYKAHWDHPSYEVFEFSSVVNNVTPDSDVFVVPANATRLVTVMHYVEPPAPAGVGKALINDFDLWLDEGDDDFGPNTGEHFAHQSQIDNTEIVILDNPMAGPWRWKVFPTNATPDAVQVAVVVVVITGDPTPNGIWNVQVDGKPFQANDNIFLQPGEQVTIMSDFDVDSYIGSAVVLERFLTIPNDPDVSSTGLYDFIVTDLTDNDIKGRSITLGDCISGAPRRGTWKYSYPTQGLFPHAGGAGRQYCHSTDRHRRYRRWDRSRTRYQSQVDNPHTRRLVKQPLYHLGVGCRRR
jgi:subtilisin family serine protease